jgi:tetratricopeptide (TPR) repeat protein
MILHLTDSRTRGLVVVAALLIGLWLSFFGLRAAIARYGYEGVTAERMELAVRLEPGNPVYWDRLGQYQQYNLEERDAALAQQSFLKAIELNPLDTNAWLGLATDYELEGRNAEAREAYLQAAKTYPASADVSWRYGNFLLRQGDQPEAYAELRRAIEADPQRAGVAFSRAYRANPDIDELLEQVFPPRQSVYVNVLWEALSTRQLAVAKKVWAQLIKLHPHLEMLDVDRLVSELLQAGEFTEARQVWDQGMSTMNLPPLLQPSGSVVWDPSFESGVNGNNFAWHFPPIVQGVSLSLDKEQKFSGNQSLRLSFDGKHNPNLEAACALAVVQPGTNYRFSGWIKTKDITTEYGIDFRLRAVEPDKTPVVNTREIHGTNPWTIVEETWIAGPSVHRVQICVSRDPSDNPDVRISGTAWVDDVNLVPQPAERHKP